MDPGAVLPALLGSPNLRRAAPVYEQYDSTVQANTVAGPGHGAAVLRIKGTTKALVAATDAQPGGRRARPVARGRAGVAEATRNVAITGARPLGVTNCLNFGDPTRPEAFWQLSEAVRGLGDACRALGLPVTGGNVSLYNESPAGAIAPTPEIGVVGPARGRRDARRARRSARTATPCCSSARRRRASRAASTRALAGVGARGRPARARPRPRGRLQAFIREAVDRGLVASCPGRVGRRARRGARRDARCGADRGARAPAAPSRDSPAVDLFGESPSRLVVTVAPRHAPALDPARPPARPAGRGARRSTGGDAAASSSSPATGATGAAEERGSRRRRRARRADRRTSATPGSTACRGRSAGTDASADVRRRSASSCPVGGHEAAAVAALGLFALQHRGQESAGVGGQRRRAADALQGPRHGQLRSSTSGASRRSAATSRSPTAATRRPARRSGRTPSRRSGSGPRRALAIGHNGNLVNTRELLGQLPRRPRPPAGLDRHRAPDRAARRRARPRTPSTPSSASCRASAARSASWSSTSSG